MKNPSEQLECLVSDAQIEFTLSFAQKPDEATLNKLKAMGITWIPDNKSPKNEGSFVIKRKWDTSNMNEDNLEELVTDLYFHQENPEAFIKRVRESTPVIEGTIT